MLHPIQRGKSRSRVVQMLATNIQQILEGADYRNEL
jgi:hypothetical protein